MSQTVECTVFELLERINRGEIPRAATFRGTIDYSAPNTPKSIRDKSVGPALKAVLGYEPERAATAKEWEAEIAEFDRFYKNVNETRRELGMRNI